MLILEILEQYSDSDHRLTQIEIVKLLNKNYGIECKRQTVKNNIILLRDMGMKYPCKAAYTSCRAILKMRSFEC